jgi:hypothetical protein
MHLAVAITDPEFVVDVTVDDGDRVCVAQCCRQSVVGG